MYIYTTAEQKGKIKGRNPNMELRGKDDEEKKLASVLQGDGLCMSRILARESSVGQTSGIFYRSAEGGVPFRWEMHPGTPKNPREDEDVMPPICPSPLMQSLGLPLPNLDPLDPPLKTSRMLRLREMVKKRISPRSKNKENSTFSSICSTSSRVVDVCMVHGPFCCSPWNTPESEGKPQSLALLRPKADNSALKRASWFWEKKERKITQQRTISFRYQEEVDASLCKSASFSSTSPLSKGAWRVSKIRRDIEGRCGPWSTSDVLVLARRKWKSLTS